MNIPKWALNDYPGAETDFSNWLEKQFTEAFYKKEYEQAFDEFTGEIKNQEVYERVKALAKFQTLQRTIEFKSTVERSQVWQLYEANKTGWFRLLPPEFDTIEELLASMVEGIEDGTSEHYDMTFLTKQAVPLLQKAGATAEQIFGLKVNISKARAAIPSMRKVIRENLPENLDNISAEDLQKGEEKTVNMLMEIAQKVLDPDIPVREFKKEMRTLMGKNYDPPPPVKGKKYKLNTCDLYIIPSIGPAQGRSLEIALRDIVSEFSQETVKQLLDDIKEIIATGNFK